MKAYCLASSSSGNCFIFEFDINGVSQTIMVECGIPMSEIYKKCNTLGIKFSSVKACLITHLHSDHSKSAKDISRLNIPIFASKPTLEAIKVKGNVINAETPNEVLKGLYVFPFEVDHDVEGAYGFLFKTSKETVIFINDSKRWNVNLINFRPDYVFIECNYDQKLVYAQIYDLQRKQKESTLSEEELRDVNITLSQHERNVNSHMSLAGCIKGLSKLNLSKCKMICLMHLSDRNANEYRMKNEVQTRFGIKTYVAGKHGGIK